MFEGPEKHPLGHLRAVKQLITVALDLEEVREFILRPLSLFNCIFPGYFTQESKRVRVVKSQNDGDTWSNGDRSFKQ